LINPFVNKFYQVNNLQLTPDTPDVIDATVQLAFAEVADPGDDHGVPIKIDCKVITLQDFVTPLWFNPFAKPYTGPVGGSPFDFLGIITKPFMMANDENIIITAIFQGSTDVTSVKTSSVIKKGIKNKTITLKRGKYINKKK